jgi:plastocyanin
MLNKRDQEVLTMARLLGVLCLVSVCAIAVMTGAARAAIVPVTITKVGYVPDSLKIAEGDTVTWTNTDVATHQIVGDKSAFTSPVLATGQSYSFAFAKAGTYRYHDSADKHLKGTVVVQAAPKPPPPAKESVSIATSGYKVTYGGRVTLSGKISGGQAGETVTVLAQPYGQSSFAQIATVTTGSGGAWSYGPRPAIQTAYDVRWRSATSSTLTIGVRPRVALTALAGGRLFTKVTAARSFAGRFVYLQRRSALGQWVNVKKVVLGSTSAARFAYRAPRGNSTLRVFLTVNQAGSGYLAGLSRTIVYHRA